MPRESSHHRDFVLYMKFALDSGFIGWLEYKLYMVGYRSPIPPQVACVGG